MGFGDAPAMPDWAGDVRRFDFLGMGSGSAKEKAEGDVRWINEFCDSLTVAIALREWDEAVKLVEDGELPCNYSLAFHRVPRPKATVYQAGVERQITSPYIKPHLRTASFALGSSSAQDCGRSTLRVSCTTSLDARSAHSLSRGASGADSETHTCHSFGGRYPIIHFRPSDHRLHGDQAYGRVVPCELQGE